MWDAIAYFGLSGFCLAVFLLRYHALSAAVKWAGAAHGINLLSLSADEVLKAAGQKHNLYLFHFSLLFVHAAYATAFYYSLGDLRVRRSLLISTVVFVFTSLGISATIQPLHEYNSYALTLSNVLLLTWSSIYLYTLFSEVRIATLEQDPMFWVSVGLLVSSLGSFFAMGLMNFLIHQDRQQAYHVHLIIEAMWFLLVVALILALLADKIFGQKSSL